MTTKKTTSGQQPTVQQNNPCNACQLRALAETLKQSIETYNALIEQIKARENNPLNDIETLSLN